MGKILPVLLLVLLSLGCIGGNSYGFDEGVLEMNEIVQRYDNAQSEPELLRMRGEIYDLYLKVESMEPTEELEALRLVLLFRINFFDARMVQNAAKEKMDKFDFTCDNIEDFRHAEKLYEEFLFYSNEAAANLEALLEAYPSYARRANIDSALVASIRSSAQLTQRSLRNSREQVEKACSVGSD